eukprot:COSAG06_NODE_2392_length_6963_cov_2.989365_2_plen_364_part_00
MSPSFVTAASTKPTTVAAHSVARGTKRRGEVRRIASPKTLLSALPVALRDADRGGSRSRCGSLRLRYRRPPPTLGHYRGRAERRARRCGRRKRLLYSASGTMDRRERQSPVRIQSDAKPSAAEVLGIGQLQPGRWTGDCIDSIASSREPQQPVNNTVTASTAAPQPNPSTTSPQSTMAPITQASEDIVGERVEVQYVPQPPLPPRSPRAQPMPRASVCWPLLPRPPLTRGAAPCPIARAGGTPANSTSAPSPPSTSPTISPMWSARPSAAVPPAAAELPPCGCCLSAVAVAAPTATVCCLRPSLPLPFVLLLLMIPLIAAQVRRRRSGRRGPQPGQRHHPLAADDDPRGHGRPAGRCRRQHRA